MTWYYSFHCPEDLQKGFKVKEKGRSRRGAEEGKEDGRDQSHNLYLNNYRGIFMFYKH